MASMGKHPFLLVVLLPSISLSDLCLQSAEIDALVRMECEWICVVLEQSSKWQCQARCAVDAWGKLRGGLQERQSRGEDK
ncbi:hypothetical protein ABZP36_003036 [Zizania latifolia]